MTLSQTQTSKQPLQPASMQRAGHKLLSPSQQLQAHSSLPALAGNSIHVPWRPRLEDRELGLLVTATPAHAGAVALCISSGHSKQ